MTRASDLAKLLGAGGTLNAALSVDTISEKTSGSGVTIDSLNVKDGGIGGQQIGGRRNIIINGAMQINQRGNTTGNGVSGGSGVYSVDRYNLYHNGSEAVANLQQSTDVPSGEGFGNSYLIDVTTAESSVAAGEIAVLRQILEGYDLQGLKYGTSSAESVTLSFYVKSPKTGVHICELYHLASSGSKTQSQSYTVNSANTWEKKTITFSGDTATALDNDSSYTIAVQWGIFAGTTYTSGTLQTSWGSIDNANRFVGQQNLFDNTSNNFYLTGVQFEVGSQATPFEHRSFGEELALCQRYFQDLNFSSQGYPPSSGYFQSDVNFPTAMRATPTATITDGSKSGTSGYTTAADSISENACRVENQTSGNNARAFHLNGVLKLDAEL